jgi:hypothetical protein
MSAMAWHVRGLFGLGYLNRCVKWRVVAQRVVAKVVFLMPCPALLCNAIRPQLEYRDNLSASSNVLILSLASQWVEFCKSLKLPHA